MEDILPIIINHSSCITSLFHYAMTNKVLYQLLSKIWGNIKFGPYVLSIQQYFMYKKVHETFTSGKRRSNIIAPMGWGKTLTALYYSKMITDDCKNDNFNFFTQNPENKNVLIVVPPAVLKVWIEELIKLKFLAPHPEKSKVLVAHSCRTFHNSYLKTIAKLPLTGTTNKGWFTNHNIVITTSQKYKKLPNILFENGGWGVGLIIFDEIHKIKVHSYSQHNHINVLGLSAELPKSMMQCIVPEWCTINNQITDNQYSEKLPQITFEYYQINNGSTNFGKKTVHISDINVHHSEYKYNLKKCIKHKSKIVICVDKGQIGDTIREMVKILFPERIVYELINSNQVIDRFYKSKEKSILYIGSSNNEGLNILAENLLIIKPDMMAVNRIRQTIGRIKRPNNPNRNVTCSFIIGGKIGLLKTFYGVCYSNENWNLGYKDFPTKSFLKRTETILSLLNCSDIQSLSPIDGCVIFDGKRKDGRIDKVLEWWTKNKDDNTILDIDKIEKLYA